MSCSGQLNPEALWFRSLSLIGTGFFTGLFITNAIYFSRINSGACNAISKSEANGLMWFNIIWAIIAGVLFIWCFIRLFFHQTKRAELTEQAKQAVVKQLQRTDVGFGTPYTTTVTKTTNIPMQTITTTPVVHTIPSQGIITSNINQYPTNVVSQSTVRNLADITNPFVQ